MSSKIDKKIDKNVYEDGWSQTLSITMSGNTDINADKLNLEPTNNRLNNGIFNFKI